MASDLILVIRWWLTLLGLGWVGWPVTAVLFKKWGSWGYFLAKIVGILLVVYPVWLFGSLHLVPFSWGSIILTLSGLVYLDFQVWKNSSQINVHWKKIAIHEVVFLGLLIFWAWIKGHEPTINGLEKFMDFGFTKSILQGSYFPPKDMWFAGGNINYYYFGHLIMATITKISGVDLVYGFNLMLATLFAMTFTMSLAIGVKLLDQFSNKQKVLGGILVAILVSLAGNLHTIYAFTSGYWGKEDAPPEFWNIFIKISDLKSLTRGFPDYWYPNATRFIPYTIHEFPSYSFVVSDIHGHVLALPLDLLLIALLVSIVADQKEEEDIGIKKYVVYGAVAGAAFMTNALDGPIYIGLFAILLINQNLKFLIFNLKTIINFKNLKPILIPLSIVGGVFLLTTLPFLVSFKPFVNGIAVNCPPAFLANKKLGPLLFEGVEKCQKSPLWMMLVLWGFFLYCGLGLGLLPRKSLRNGKFMVTVSVFCLFLIIFPEFFYFKDIYPMHFRSNTMFKLGYQVFILMSIVSGVVITSMVVTKKRIGGKLFLTGVIPLLILVLMYPYFSVKSYFNSLDDYKGLYGVQWMSDKYPDYLAVVDWFKQNVPAGQQPVILEAAGDSYTDYDLVSAFTGLPTVAGWQVHEWLWRGDYGPIAARNTDVQTIFELGSYYGKDLINKYGIKYIIVGDMERTKYSKLDEEGIKKLANPVFSYGKITIYKTI